MDGKITETPFPTDLEYICCFDWAEPTKFEREVFNIHPDNTNARISFRNKGSQVWIVEWNNLRIYECESDYYHDKQTEVASYMLLVQHKKWNRG